MLAAFINGDVSKSEGLVNGIQKLSASNPKLKTFVVYMGGPELKESISKLAADKGLSIPLTFLPKGAGEGDIGAYKISASAKNTVLLWSRTRVVHNFVDVTRDSWTNVEKAAADLAK